MRRVRRRVRIWRSVPHVLAECEQCKWSRSGVGASDGYNARAAAKRHAESHGHKVWVDRTVTTYMEPEQ